jgi:hypothetical protein
MKKRTCTNEVHRTEYFCNDECEMEFTDISNGTDKMTARINTIQRINKEYLNAITSGNTMRAEIAFNNLKKYSLELYVQKKLKQIHQSEVVNNG